MTGQGPPLLKRIERAVKRVAIGAAVRVASPSPASPPDWAARPHRVLYLRYDRIGDMIMATGLLRAIATAHPTVELHVLASPSNVGVLDGNPHVRKTLVFDRRAPGSFLQAARALRHERYDAVVAGMLIPSATTIGLMLATRAAHRIGVVRSGDQNVYTIAVPAVSAERPFVEQVGQLVRAFGLDPDAQDWRYDLTVRDDERARAEALWAEAPGSPRVLINISAFTAARRWPADRYVAVVRHVLARLPRARVLVTGDPTEWELVRRVAREGGASPACVSPVRVAFALVATADALVTPDTSLAHAAAATRTPAAVLINGHRTVDAPFGAGIIRITSSGELRELPVEPVLSAIEPLLQAASARRAAGDQPPQPSSAVGP